jgi:hypothetical protein
VSEKERKNLLHQKKEIEEKIQIANEAAQAKAKPSGKGSIP